jgi:hypothetical protein
MLRSLGFLFLFFALMAVWIVAWLVFHIAGGLIHLLLIAAAIMLLLHLVRPSQD